MRDSLTFFEPTKSRAERKRKRLLRKVWKLKDVGYHDPNGVIRDLYMPRHSKMMMFGHQLATIARGGLHEPITGIDFHPDYLYLTMFKIGQARYFRKEAYCFMFYLLDVAKIAVSFNLRTLRRSLLASHAYPAYHEHLKRFFELFDHLEDWWLTVDEAIGKGNEWGLLLLGRKFTTPNEGKIQTTCTWMQFSEDNPMETIENGSEQRMVFRSKMLAENGFNEMGNLSLVVAEPFEYSDYPTDYMTLLQHAIHLYENNTNSDSAEGYNWTSESSFEF